MDELARIRAENARRDREVAPDFYALDRPANLFARHGQERALLDGLRWARLLPLAGRKILEVGCAAGGWLAALEAFGATRANLAGIDLEPARIAAARARLPGADLVAGDAAKLPWPDSRFDAVLQLTVFSSILDAGLRRAVAAEMLRVVRPGGAVVWYDFVYDNPRNPHVKGIARAELRALFPGQAARFARVTLAPPLARRLVPLSWALGRALESLRVLNTHDLAVFIK